MEEHVVSIAKVAISLPLKLCVMNSKDFVDPKEWVCLLFCFLLFLFPGPY